MKLKRSGIVILPIVTTLILGSLISVLVFTLVRFSEEITEYYNPAILASENLMEATSHLQSSLQGKTAAEMHKDIAFIHFRTAWNHFLEVIDTSGRKRHRIEHEGDGFADGQRITTLVEQGEGDTALALLSSFNDFSKEHYLEHVEELRRAKRRVTQLSFTIAALSMVVLLLGIIMAFREQRVQTAIKSEREMVAAITALVNALEARDPYTKGHSTRVAGFAVAVGKELGMAGEELNRLHLSGILHDIGKIGVPDHVLLKPGRLTDDEFSHIKAHPEIGTKIIQGSEALTEIRNGILKHHERYDGKGYPLGLKGDEIPLCAQCIAIADTFDAMTSSRPYRKALSVEVTLAEISKCRGTQWSEQIVDAFLKAHRHGLIVPGLDLFTGPAN